MDYAYCDPSKSDGSFLPASVVAALATFEQRKKDVEDARRAIETATEDVEAAKRADRVERPADFKKIEQAKQNLERAGWAHERAQTAATEAFESLLTVVESESEDGRASIAAAIAEEDEQVKAAATALLAAIENVDTAIVDMNFLLRPWRKERWTDELREQITHAPEGYRALRDAANAIVNPPAPTAPREPQIVQRSTEVGPFGAGRHLTTESATVDEDAALEQEPAA
jgi:hypothetical protein